MSKRHLQSWSGHAVFVAQGFHVRMLCFATSVCAIIGSDDNRIPYKTVLFLALVEVLVVHGRQPAGPGKRSVRLDG